MNKNKNFGELMITALYLAFHAVRNGLSAFYMTGYLNEYSADRETGGFMSRTAYGIMLRSFYGDIVNALICVFLFIITLACFIMVKKQVSEDKEINLAFLNFVGWTDILYISYKVIMSVISVVSRMLALRSISSGTGAAQTLGIWMGLSSLGGLIGIILIVSLAVLLWRMSREDDE